MFSAFAVLGFAAAYVGPTGAALAEAHAAPPPVTLYMTTIADVQTLAVSDSAASGPVSLSRGGYTVYVTPKPTPTPSATSTKKSTAATTWAAPLVTPDPGSAQAIAYEMVVAHGWGDNEFACLVALWNRESGWRVNAANSSGAYGIPQALPGSKMASAGSDWATNPATQITWGLGYITGRYGTPCGAWGHSNSSGWY